MSVFERCRLNLTLQMFIPHKYAKTSVKSLVSTFCFRNVTALNYQAHYFCQVGTDCKISTMMMDNPLLKTRWNNVLQVSRNLLFYYRRHTVLSKFLIPTDG